MSNHSEFGETIGTLKEEGMTLLRETGAALNGAFGRLGEGSASARDVAMLAGIGLGILAIVIMVLILRRRGVPDTRLSLGRQTRGVRLLGAGAALLFFGVFGVWSWNAPLSSAAVAHGVVSPDGARKTVQHLEGGIIRSIHVREGDRVEAGMTLVTLDDVQAVARLQELHERQTYLSATEARLIAEEQDSESIAFPLDLLRSDEARASNAMSSQTALFENRRESQSAHERILRKRVDQLDEEILGLREVILAEEEQLALLQQELEIAQELHEQGLQRLSPVLELQRRLADIRAQRAANRATIARLGQQIGETELQLFASRQQLREEVSEELARVRAELASIRSQIPEREDALARTVIQAPISGRVMNILVTTEGGGVLGPRDPILEIVPEEGALIIDARIRPQDIDTVYPGMSARVILTAYTQRNLPQIYGELRSVSADRLTDQRTGEPYFLAKVHIAAEELARVQNEVELMAGMPADVMVLTGEQTLLDYILKPLSDSLRLSFRES